MTLIIKIYSCESCTINENVVGNIDNIHLSEICTLNPQIVFYTFKNKTMLIINLVTQDQISTKFYIQATKNFT